MASTRASLHDFLRRLASRKPVPGGGSVAALAGAVGCALAAKVGRIILSRDRSPRASTGSVGSSVRQLDRMTARLEALMKEDAVAYLGLVQALRQGRGRKQALRRANQSPRAVRNLSARALKEARNLARWAGPRLGSDLKAAKELLRAASKSASAMVEANQ